MHQRVELKTIKVFYASVRKPSPFRQFFFQVHFVGGGKEAEGGGGERSGEDVLPDRADGGEGWKVRGVQ